MHSSVGGSELMPTFWKQEICGIEPDQVRQRQYIGESTIGWHPPIQPHTAAAQNGRAWFIFPRD
jgi:hypothetical protein